ncbi:MAG: hypothetical protein BroJett011_76190 [Chloroflexota bacterium]|nr:MAG: hypothetical protein BroJett011_76190 [Chloroflexota bacterium]
MGKLLWDKFGRKKKTPTSPQPGEAGAADSPIGEISEGKSEGQSMGLIYDFEKKEL